MSEGEGLAAEVLCALGAGDVSGWHGLPPLTQAGLPACLEPAGEQGWLEFRPGYLAYRVWRLEPEGTTLWLFTGEDGLVRLVEVFDLPASTPVDDLLRDLGTPDLELEYSLVAQLQRPLRRPDEELVEHVFAGRGLALLVGRTAGQTARLARLRGFQAMAADAYRQQFVDLPEMRFFPED